MPILTLRPHCGSHRHIYRYLQHFEEGAECPAIALVPTSTYALAHRNLGRAYDKADRPQDALNSLDQALQLNPNLLWAVELRNQIRQRLKS